MLKKIIDKINESKKIAIFCHENPDGDAIGSLLGLGTLLENMGKDITFVAPTKPSKIFDFLPGFKKIQSEFDYGNYDLIIFVDCSELNRIGKIGKEKQEYFDDKDVIVFDHHEIKERNKQRLKIIDPKATSCCEVIFETVKDIWKDFLTPEVATYFYLGLTTDSGNFRFDEDHERIFTNALNLIKYGADKKLITENLINSKSYDTIKFFKVLLERLTWEGDILYSYYDIAELTEYGIDNEQAGFGLTILQEIKGPKITMTIRKDGDHIKCSMRSKKTDVNKVAKHFGGGGHIHAAGFVKESTGKIKNDVKEIIDEIKKLI